jgi:hypothetical protein
MHLALRPRRSDLALLGGKQQSDIADEIQPQLLMYRAHNFDAVRNFSAEKQEGLGGDIARSLTASVLGESEIIQLMNPAIRRMEQEKITDRGCDVHQIMMEAVWGSSHQDREIAVSRLTELANALLRSRGEILEYSAAEIGWKLRNLGFDRHRNGRGMVLRFSLENRILLHRRAEGWGLDLRKVPGCDLCFPQPAVAE